MMHVLTTCVFTLGDGARLIIPRNQLVKEVE